MEYPCRRSSITRPRTRSLAGAAPGGGPGFLAAANSSSFPARCWRTRSTIAHRVYPNLAPACSYVSPSTK